MIESNKNEIAKLRYRAKKHGLTFQQFNGGYVFYHNNFAIVGIGKVTCKFRNSLEEVETFLDELDNVAAETDERENVGN